MMKAECEVLLHQDVDDRLRKSHSLIAGNSNLSHVACCPDLGCLWQDCCTHHEDKHTEAKGV